MAYTKKQRTELIEDILRRLSDGDSMNAICRDKKMPDRDTIRRWANDDEHLNTAITHAREDGYERRADQAVADAKAADDPTKGRLAFDAERWYLGKLSNAFRDKGVLDPGPGAANVKIEIEYV